MSWAHQHGEACRSCPDLKEVLEGRCWGAVKAVWGCVDGHSYVMDAQCADVSTRPSGGSGFIRSLSRPLGGSNCDELMSEEEEQEHQQEEEEEEEQSIGNGKIPAGSTTGLDQHSPAQTQSSAPPEWTSNTQGEMFYL